MANLLFSVQRSAHVAVVVGAAKRYPRRVPLPLSNSTRIFSSNNRLLITRRSRPFGSNSAMIERRYHQSALTLESQAMLSAPTPPSLPLSIPASTKTKLKARLTREETNYQPAIKQSKGKPTKEGTKSIDNYLVDMTLRRWLPKEAPWAKQTYEIFKQTYDPSQDAHKTSGTAPAAITEWENFKTLYKENIPSFLLYFGEIYETNEEFQNLLNRLKAVGFRNNRISDEYISKLDKRTWDEWRLARLDEPIALAQMELQEASKILDKAKTDLLEAESTPVEKRKSSEWNKRDSNNSWEWFAPQPAQQNISDQVESVRGEERITELRSKVITCTEEFQSKQSSLDKLIRRQGQLREAINKNKATPQLESAVQSTLDVICPFIAQYLQQRYHDKLTKFNLFHQNTDLTKPHEWYMYTRLDKRKIIFHGGPTNSGKTHAALERLKTAKKGLYLGPLRLLGSEIFERFTSEGIYCNLLTGQEQQLVPFATHTAATVEIGSADEEFDVVVVDEIQMIADKERGSGWTEALLGTRCKEIHLCGGLESERIVRRIAQACGDELEIRRYERFSELKVADTSLASKKNAMKTYAKVQKGDCVVAFSRKDLFAIKREIETTTSFKCCIIYGTLPPKTRLEQARLFNDPDSGYDILVASDAIGMGLNLNIGRIIFNSIYKHDGHEVIRLSHSTIKQIAGRAGRHNSIYATGEVTCRDPRDLTYIRESIKNDVPPIEKAGLEPSASHIESFSRCLKIYNPTVDADDIHQVLRQYHEMASIQSDYFITRQQGIMKLAELIAPLNLSLKDKYTLLMCPLPKNTRSLQLFLRFASKLAAGEVAGVRSRAIQTKPESFDHLANLCSSYSELDLFLWLQRKFPPGNEMEMQLAQTLKEEVIEVIRETLHNSDHLKLEHCYVDRDKKTRAKYNASLIEKNQGGRRRNDKRRFRKKTQRLLHGE